MKNEVLDKNDDLKEFFTIDAWRLVKTFFTNLHDKLKEEGIPESQQQAIAEDLDYYVSEFVGDYKDKEKLSYEIALKLLREIGSPTDIIMALESEKIPNKTSDIKVSIKRKNQHICSSCQYPNSVESIFCENCGKKLVSEKKLKETLKQEAIDHPYSASFLLIYGFLGVIGFFWEMLFNQIYDRSFTIISPTFTILLISLIMMLIPGIIFALIVGAVLDHLFKGKKSVKFQYNELLNHFEEYVTLGFFFVLLSSIIFGLFAMMGFPLFLILALIQFITSIIWLMTSQGKRPQEIPYFTLLTKKRVFSNIIDEKFTKINMYWGTIIVILLIIWNFFLYNLFFDPPITFEGAIIVSILQIIAVFSALNGYLMMYYYSWSYVNRYITQGVENK
jgi:hypothetical protein